MNGYRLIWSPTGQCIATVQAKNARAAIRKAPAPYRKYLGEIRAEHDAPAGLTPDQVFFFVHAGYSYDPKTETQEVGHAKCAVRLAAAESLFLQCVKLADVGIEWQHDPDAARDNRKDRVRFEQCESACIWHRDECGDVHYLASLGGILDADTDYRRVVRAELAIECEDALQAIVHLSNNLD